MCSTKCMMSQSLPVFNHFLSFEMVPFGSLLRVAHPVSFSPGWQWRHGRACGASDSGAVDLPRGFGAALRVLTTALCRKGGSPPVWSLLPCLHWLLNSGPDELTRCCVSAWSGSEEPFLCLSHTWALLLLLDCLKSGSVSHLDASVMPTPPSPGPTLSALVYVPAQRTQDFLRPSELC